MADKVKQDQPKQEAPKQEPPKEQPKPDANALVLKNAAGQMVSLDYGEDAGSGLELANQGGSVPFLSLLQPLSNALKEGNDRYIPEAKAGMFCLASQKKVWDGKKGVFFIGITESHIVVEKTALDASGKWVADHSPSSQIVAAARAKGGKKSELRTEQGHPLVETYRMYGVVYDSLEDLKAMKVTPVVLSFERTKLKARQSFMDRVRMYKKALPLYAVQLHISSKPEKWEKGDGYGLNIRFAVDDDLLKSLILPNDPFWATWAGECRKIKSMVESGAIKGEAGTEVEGDAGGDGGSDIPF
jgi:hypothetical protein